MKVRTLIKLVILLCVIVGVSACDSKEEISLGQLQRQAETILQWSEPPHMALDTNKTYLARVQTNLGAFMIELFDDDAPTTVNNFVFLSEQGFYEGTTFHYVIESFMVQGGDPLGNGRGGPGYTIEDELEQNQKYGYKTGIVAMARPTGSNNTFIPDSAGSQFFICTGPDALLLEEEPVYAVFGQVVEGMDTVMKIAKAPEKTSMIEMIEIIEG